MAGTNPDFDAAAFRAAIKQTMQMGLPSNPAQRVTFLWRPVRSFTAQDGNQMPYDWADTPASEVIHPPTQVDVALQMLGGETADGQYTPIGRINQPVVVLTVLDVDFAQLDGANAVEIDGSMYDILYWAPPMGLFDVTVYQCYAQARDER